jgi:hypothetical protein
MDSDQLLSTLSSAVETQKTHLRLRSFEVGLSVGSDEKKKKKRGMLSSGFLATGAFDAGAIEALLEQAYARGLDDDESVMQAELALLDSRVCVCVCVCVCVSVTTRQSGVCECECVCVFV